jgi:hypothetical protein
MLRPYLRLIASVVLAAVIGGVGMPLFGDLHTENDVACAEDLGFVPSHHQTTQIETVRPAHSDGHCAICHLQRALNGAADDAKRFAAALEAAAAHVVVVERAVIARGTRNVPSRAPPSSL